MGPEFWQTIMGKRLIEGDIPRLIKALERIAEALDEPDLDEPINVKLTQKGMEVTNRRIPSPPLEPIRELAVPAKKRLVRGETHTAKIRNKLSAISFGNEMSSDQEMAITHIVEHLAAIDVDTYELELTISDLKNSIGVLGARIRYVEEADRESRAQLEKFVKKATKWVCSECGGSSVQLQMWVDPNTGDNHGDVEPVAASTCYCATCENNIWIIEREEYERRKKEEK